MNHSRRGNCLILIIAIVFLVWLLGMGGCELIKKKTQEGLNDTPAPVPAKPVTPAAKPVTPEKKA
jgi:hypothetical protein